MTLRTPLLPAALAAAALLSACAVPAPATTPESSAARRGEPTYQSAAANPFIASSRAAVDELVKGRSEEHTSELQSHLNLVCRLLLEKKKKMSHNELMH